MTIFRTRFVLNRRRKREFRWLNHPQITTILSSPVHSVNTIHASTTFPNRGLVHLHHTDLSLDSSQCHAHFRCVFSQLTENKREHLYRKHQIYQCPRCKDTFKNQESLDVHLHSSEWCERVDSEVQVEGITAQIERRLRSKKKAYREQSDVDRWKEIYRILFPGSEVPSPCKLIPSTA